MIAGILPLVLALQKSGIISLVSDGFIQLLSGAGPFAVLAGVVYNNGPAGVFPTSKRCHMQFSPRE